MRSNNATAAPKNRSKTKRLLPYVVCNGASRPLQWGSGQGRYYFETSSPLTGTDANLSNSVTRIDGTLYTCIVTAFFIAHLCPRKGLAMRNMIFVVLGVLELAVAVVLIGL